MFRQIPGDLGFPILGKSIEQFTEHHFFYWQQYQKYGKIFKTQIMWLKTICLIGADANRFVLNDKAENFSSQLGWSFLEPLLGTGLLTLDGNKHRTLKKIMYPLFHGEIINNYFEIIYHTAIKTIPTLINKPNGLLLFETRQLALQIMGELLIKSNNKFSSQKLVILFNEVIQGIETVLRWDIPITKFGKAKSARRKLEDFLLLVITEKRKNNSQSDQEDILGVLINATDEQGNKFTNSELVRQVLQLLFGGYDTISKMLCWSLFELNRHPQWLNKLRQEQTSILNGESLKISHLKKLTNMNYLLKEIERLYPPIYMIPRTAVNKIEYDDYIIPQGCLVLLSPLITHRLPELYEQPNIFSPERFAPPREEHKKHPYSLIGFGGGVHRCLGDELAQMELKVIVSILLQYYDWQITPMFPDNEPIIRIKDIEDKMQAKFISKS
jgi:cytochrome P450